MASTKQRGWSPEGCPDPGREPAARGASSVRRYKTHDLFGECPWIVIEHGGTEYRLQVTRLGKLILTK
jgi:hemin uptake protein HemP